MSCEVDTRLYEIHQRALDRSLGHHVLQIFLSRHPPHLIEVVRIAVNVPKLLDEDVFGDHSRVSPREAVDELSPLAFAFVRRLLVRVRDLLSMRPNGRFVPDEYDAVSEGGVGDFGR